MTNPQLLVAWHWERYQRQALSPRMMKVDAFRRTFYAGARAMHRLLGPLIESIPRDDAFLAGGTFLNDGTLLTQRELLEKIRLELDSTTLQSEIRDFLTRQGLDPNARAAMDAVLRQVEKREGEE